MNFLLIKNIYIKVVLALLFLSVADNLVLLVFGKQTKGTVVQFVVNYAGGSRYPAVKYPVIEFTTSDKKYRFNGNWDADYQVGDTAQVIYKSWRPKRAKVKTFWGIAKKPVVQLVIAIIIWSMFYSSFKPKK